VSLTWRRMNGLNSQKIHERVGEKLLAELQRERRAQVEGSERYQRLAKDMIATPRNGLRVELVVSPDRRAFDCADLPYYALVSIASERGWLTSEGTSSAIPPGGCRR
jgi:sugar-specific transcriptional regulator TrmB